jgi:hypothetical protein
MSFRIAARDGRRLTPRFVKRASRSAYCTAVHVRPCADGAAPLTSATVSRCGDCRWGRKGRRSWLRPPHSSFQWKSPLQSVPALVLNPLLAAAARPL